MKRSWLLLLLPAAVLIWWGLSRREPAVVIHMATVDKATIESTISTNGKVEPAEWAAARPLFAGVVSSVMVQRGDIVQQGQPLVSMDVRMSKTELAGAVARKQAAQAEATTLNQGGKAATLASLDDSLRVAHETEAAAQRNYDSLQRLLSQQAATKIQVQDAKDALDRASLQVSSIEHQRTTLVTGMDKQSALARVEEAQSAVDLAAARLQYGVVRAPIKGTLYQFDLRRGAYLQAGELAALVGRLDQVKVTVYVDEPDLGRVSLGMPVKISWDARPGESWIGKVDRLPSQVIALGTRTVGEVTTIVENPNRDLLPGVTVNATIISRVVRDATSVPKAALRSMHGETGVYRMSNGELKWTRVKPGASDISNVEIVSGVGAGDKVAERVVEPADAELKDGLRVKAEQ